MGVGGHCPVAADDRLCAVAIWGSAWQNVSPKSCLRLAARSAKGAGMTRILLWYWGRRGGGAQFSLSLARALAPGGLVLSLSRQNALLGAFRALPVAA
jgi:hypothetical protein